MPKNFKLNAAQAKYDGTAHPDTWLDDYLVAIRYAGGDKSTAMQYLQLQLTGSARAWLKSLPAECIRSWDDLVRIFSANFQGTFERPTTIGELRGCHQKEGESIRAFI